MKHKDSVAKQSNKVFNHLNFPVFCKLQMK